MIKLRRTLLRSADPLLGGSGTEQKLWLFGANALADTGVGRCFIAVEQACSEGAENAIKEIKQDLSHGPTLRDVTAKD